ncbi:MULTISPECIES: hypothetical protein [Moorena]|uniref:Uncharacterized protein n=1 Tax=Moorena producens 3L TaxID=489825 RepID=F4XP94_9CYAN|nr:MULTISPECIES: hypothetical protein [Moorena]NEQ12800.1 hypothetical protein [Moorena sp. SIO3E2]NES81804.1 hypothetical protein [Moorena sp. SIO2B7]EGJ33629.1 hypothetical protein LYNGBM3L_28780 [Moorena producens 3L]NEP36837.1 hypothetical protein [Moorena sp. SIO3B2]NEP69672.1 hypothetical protein [Moorena sp. SIO3A5]
MLKFKSLGLSIISASVVFHSQALACVPESVLDRFTNFYFWQANPEMSDKNIKSHQTQYKKEWLAIKKVLKDRIVWREIPSCYADDVTYDYDLKDYRETITALIDAVFYASHPELKGRKLRPSETHLVREWNSIKQSFSFSWC